MMTDQSNSSNINDILINLIGLQNFQVHLLNNQNLLEILNQLLIQTNAIKVPQVHDITTTTKLDDNNDDNEMLPLDLSLKSSHQSDSSSCSGGNGGNHDDNDSIGCYDNNDFLSTSHSNIKQQQQPESNHCRCHGNEGSQISDTTSVSCYGDSKSTRTTSTKNSKSSNTSLCDNFNLPRHHWKPRTFDFNYYFNNHVKRFTANDVCKAHCEMLYKDHYHCEIVGCHEVMQGKEKLRYHGQWHTVAKEVSMKEYVKCIDEMSCDVNKLVEHVHCKFAHCDYVSVCNSGGGGVSSSEIDDPINDLDRLRHIEMNHYRIVLKRINMHHNNGHLLRENLRNSKKINSTKSINRSKLLIRTSSINNNKKDDNKYENNFNDYSQDNNYTQDTDSHNIIANNQYNVNQCTRIFCNLKKMQHYHCPICDVGCSKRELFERHFRRHKY